MRSSFWVAVLFVAVVVFAVFAFVPIGEEARAQSPTVSSATLGNGWSVDIDGQIPVFKIVESQGSGTKADVVPNIGYGAALSWYYYSKANPEHAKLVAINFPIVILSNRIDSENVLDVTIAFDVGVFDNKARFGLGWELGKLPYDRTRLVGLLSIGTSIF